ncbi:MAG: hypothetical protein RR554_09275, partial [Vagococcus sp.]|uniref:hypothetical protein n=1 Tax=Vagococcus sp. TaxID=1933889 RepID=UPI002FCBD2A1
FALVFSYLLFRMIKVSITFTFLFLAISLLFLFVILTVYPEYEIVDEADYPEASIVESLFLFIIGFFSIFIIKADKRLGTAHSLPFFFLFLLIVVIIYLVLLYKTKPERRYSKSLTQKVIFKGMLTNFILVFCPFYQLIEHGGQAIYQVYGVYLAGIIVSPTIFSLLGKQVKRTQLVFWGILLGLVLLLFNSTFFIGIFVVTLFNSHLNQLLNQWVYKNGDLPQDYRLYAKYRLNNLGSIIHQIVMMLLIYLITLITRSASIGEIFMSYSNKVVDESAFFTLDITKYFLILVFTIYLFVLRKNSHNKKASKINS